MHLFMLVSSIGLATMVRLLWRMPQGSWQHRWNLTLGAFLFAPLLLLTSAIALFWMGPCGQMARAMEGWGSYVLSIGFLSAAVVLGLKLAGQAWQACDLVQALPQGDIQGAPVRLLEQETPFVAQIGFWQPELVVSQGLLTLLDAAHLEAVLIHEQAHFHYRDTFWFFGLGWLKRLTAWLPQTEALWQELLILRELRADRWAVQQIDGLLLAEALLSVVSASHAELDCCAALSSEGVRARLTERIDALLDNAEPLPQNRFFWYWLPLVLVPFLVVPFHFLK